MLMSPRKRISVYLDPEQLEGLKAIKAQTFAPEAASIRQAVTEYLQRRGVAGRAPAAGAAKPRHVRAGTTRGK